MLLIENCRLVATMDDSLRELSNVDLLIEGPRITAIGPSLRELLHDRIPADVAALDASHHLVTPGFVNTHHHLWQVLTRTMPRVQSAELFHWLIENYKVWEGVTPEDVYAGALVSLGELLLSGCTTAADHHYLFPKGQPVELWDETVRAARELGIRFHPTRASMTLGVDEGGLPPMTLVESVDRVLHDYERVIRAYHDPDDFAMTRVSLAPCAPFNVHEDLFRETARLARLHGLRIHTHLAETKDEEVYCLEKFGCRPFDYVAGMGWEGPDVWFAHCVELNDAEIQRFAESGTGVAHCPSANARLGSGIAPVPRMLDRGVRVGMGVDGTSSNDSGSLLGEGRIAFRMHRATAGSSHMDPRQVLRMLTRGGADVLGYNRIGQIAEGFAADILLFDLERLEFAGGASLDPIAALIMCGLDSRPEVSLVNGRIVVQNGQLVNCPLMEEQGRPARGVESVIARKANSSTARLIKSAQQRHGIDFLKPLEWRPHTAIPK